MLEKQLKDIKKGYVEFQDRTDQASIEISKSYAYFIERDEKHLAALNELIKHHRQQLYAGYYK